MRVAILVKQVPKFEAMELGPGGRLVREGLELASLLQRAARAMLTISDSFNWMFINFPQQPAAHWYVQLFPRLTMHAGTPPAESGNGGFDILFDEAGQQLAVRQLRTILGDEVFAQMLKERA